MSDLNSFSTGLLQQIEESWPTALRYPLIITIEVQACEWR